MFWKKSLFFFFFLRKNHAPFLKKVNLFFIHFKIVFKKNVLKEKFFREKPTQLLKNSKSFFWKETTQLLNCFFFLREKPLKNSNFFKPTQLLENSEIFVCWKKLIYFSFISSLSLNYTFWKKSFFLFFVFFEENLCNYSKIPKVFFKEKTQATAQKLQK